MKAALYQAACVAVPKGLGGVVTLVLNGWLLTRMTPVEFGLYALCLTLVALADGIVGAAIDMGVVKLASTHRHHDARRARAAEWWALLGKLSVSGAVAMLLLITGRPLAQALFHRDDLPLLLLAMCVATCVLLLRSLGVRLQVRQRFEAYAMLELMAQALRVAGILAVMLWWTPSAQSLTTAAVVTGVLTLLLGLPVAGVRWRAERLSWRDGRELLATSRWLLMTFATSAVLSRVDVLLLTQWSQLEQVGIFAAAQVFAAIPEMLGMWLSVVLSPRVLPAAREGLLRALLLRMQMVLAALAVAVALVAMVLLHGQAGWLPEGYVRMADVLMPLLIGALAGLMAMPLVVPTVMFTRPAFVVAYDLLSLPLLLWAYHLAITQSGAVGAAWVNAGSRILKTVLLHAMAWKWAGAPQGVLAEAPR